MIDYSNRTPVETEEAGKVKEPSWLQQLQAAERNVKAGLVTSAELVGRINRDKIFDPNLAETMAQ